MMVNLTAKRALYVVRHFLAFLFVWLICTATLLARSEDPVENIETEPATEPLAELPDNVLQAAGVSTEEIFEARTAEQVDFFQAYFLAVEKAERLPILNERLEQANARRRQAWAGILPDISLRATSRTYPRLDEDQVTWPEQRRDHLDIVARQPLISGFDEWAAFRSSYQDIKAQENHLYHDAGRMLMDMADLYYGLIQLEKSVETREEILSLTRSALNELNRRYAVGRSRQSEVLNTRTQLLRLEAEIQSMKERLHQARLELQSLTGIPAGKELIADLLLSVPEMDEEKALELVEYRFDVQAAQARRNMADAGVLQARGGHLPSVYIEGAYRLRPRDEVTERSEYYARIIAELPIFSGGAVVARSAEARSRAREAGLELRQTIRLAELEIRQAMSAYRSSLGELEAYERALEVAEQNYRVQLRDYRLNLITNLELLNSLSELQNTRELMESAMMRMNINRIWLGVATGEFPVAFERN